MPESPLIEKAVALHKEGDLKQAEKAYKEAIKKHTKDKRLYCNLAALLRADARPEEAAVISQKGISAIGEESPALLNTLGNSLRDLGRHVEAINCYRRALKQQPDYFDPQISLLACLEDLQFNSLANLTLQGLLRIHGFKKDDLNNRIINLEIKKAGLEQRDIHPAVQKWMYELQNQSEQEALPKVPDHWFQAAQICLRHNRIDEAHNFYKKGIEALHRYSKLKSRKLTDKQIQSVKDVASWNFSCLLLRCGDFKNGWQLYDHGLVTPAKEPQRWQRSLYKPFSLTRIPLWRGENLKGKRLLLLGEQGVGDVMMFATCIPNLIKEGASVTLIVTKRLEPIYKKALPKCRVISEKEMKNSPCKPEEFDIQCPLGSILQHRFTKLEDYGKNAQILKANEDNVRLLRKRYETDKPLIGVSWQGGGRGQRVKEKSIDVNEFFKALIPINARFISLQYGDDSEIINRIIKKHKVDLIDDPEIQAMKDMDTWIDQVAVCDAVISIANTTIHAAGGLGKPTLCLLGMKADWRWLNDENQTHSYWYPTVEIARQDLTNKSWQPALSKIKDWLDQKSHVIQQAKL